MKRARSTLNANLLSGEGTAATSLKRSGTYLCGRGPSARLPNIHALFLRPTGPGTGCVRLYVDSRLVCMWRQLVAAARTRCQLSGSATDPDSVSWKPAAADVSSSPDRRVPTAARGKCYILLLQLGAFETSMDVTSQEAQLGHAVNSLTILEVSHPLSAPV
jgi:hypothetical protein